MGVLTRSMVLGLAAGGRSSVSFAVPVLAAVRGHEGGGSRLAWALARSAVLGEVVVDKLPSTPSRLDEPMLAVRVGAGSLGALALSVLERRRPGAHVVAALAGAAGSLLGSVTGAAWRSWAAEEGPEVLRPDLRAALLEDAVVLTAACALVATSRWATSG